MVLRKTGLTVEEHQRRTVDGYLALREAAPEVPWVPVLQGFTADEYLRCVDRYEKAGVSLRASPLVGLGSICRRQATTEIELLVRRLAVDAKLRLHGFGLKLLGLARCGPWLHSADSMAWSYDARRRAPLLGCHHANCANCLRYAGLWCSRVLALMDHRQPRRRRAGEAGEPRGRATVDVPCRSGGQPPAGGRG